MLLNKWITGTMSFQSVISTSRLHQQLVEQLSAQYPDADDETLFDSADGFSNLTETVAAVLRSRREDLALASALKAQIAEMRERLGRLEARAETKRDLVASALAEAKVKRIIEPDFTVSLRPAPPALVVTDEAVIPEDYWVPQPPKLDRLSLLAALKRGKATPGATLNNPQMTISVRTK